MRCCERNAAAVQPPTQTQTGGTSTQLARGCPAAGLHMQTAGAAQPRHTCTPPRTSIHARETRQARTHACGQTMKVIKAYSTTGVHQASPQQPTRGCCPGLPSPGMQTPPQPAPAPAQAPLSGCNSQAGRVPVSRCDRINMHGMHLQQPRPHTGTQPPSAGKPSHTPLHLPPTAHQHTARTLERAGAQRARHARHAGLGRERRQEHRPDALSPDDGQDDP